MAILKNKKIVIPALISFFVLIIGGLFFYHSYSANESGKKITTANPLAISNTEEPKEESKVTYYVEVKGAVVNPGVYQVQAGSIINDVITLAGGFTKNAYTNNINLSHKVSNELVIFVYTKTEYQNAKKSPEVVNTKTEVCICDTYVIDACTENTVSIIESPSNNSDEIAKTPNVEVETSNIEVIIPNSIIEEANSSHVSTEEQTSTFVNINTATISEFTTLSGIGEAKAQDIIKYREENGSFKSIEEIKNVSGIGDKIYEKIKDYITVK